uniref:Uncharacterized protein n=1 Tax=Anser brachyrhynchus TaxID=132585 RepID=A0A8B9CFS5_9AVES
AECSCYVGVFRGQCLSSGMSGALCCRKSLMVLESSGCKQPREGRLNTGRSEICISLTWKPATLKARLGHPQREVPYREHLFSWRDCSPFSLKRIVLRKLILVPNYFLSIQLFSFEEASLCAHVLVLTS